MNTLEFIKTRKEIHAIAGVWHHNLITKGYDYWIKYRGVDYRTASYVSKSEKWEYRLKEAIADRVVGKDNNLVMLEDYLFQLPG